MSINIKNPHAEHLARTLSQLTGQSITQIVIRALEDTLLREEGRRNVPHLENEILKIAHRCASLPTLDTRSASEILSYNQHGLPD